MKRDRPYAVIIGAGFAGSILARVLRRMRKNVILIEKDRHPRFALGESTTPLGNLALERLAARYRLEDLRHLAAYGRWLDELPHLRRGLKRGFTFFAHQRDQPYTNSAQNESRLMVAASPSDALADSHWMRADIDHHLARRAALEGVDLREATTVEDVDIGEDSVQIRVRGPSGVDLLEAEIVVDASGGGTSGPIARALGLSSRLDRTSLDTSLLFAHMDGVQQLREVAPGAYFGDSPYPEERAAVHHLLDIGWLYVLRFDHGPASVGLVLRNDRSPISPEHIERSPERALRRLLAAYPSLGATLKDASPLKPVGYRRRLQHRLGNAAGRRWFLLPSAYAFYDPMFSTGIAWNLLAVERLASMVEGRYGDEREYALLLSQEADHLESLLDSAYLTMNHFDSFVAIASLYFAAASFAEAQQRLRPSAGGKPDSWHGFLGARDPVLTSLVMQARDRLRRAARVDNASGQAPGTGNVHRDLLDWLPSRLSSRDIIGLDSPAHRRLYAVDFEVLQQRSDRLGMTPEEIFAALPRLRGESR